MKEVRFSRSWWMAWINVVIGSFLLAAGFAFFIAPYHITPGGVFGLGIILNYLYPGIEIGTYGLFFDIPLLTTSFLVFGGNVGARTIVSAGLSALFINALRWFGETPDLILGGRIDLSNDILLACIFGGVLVGVGVGLVMRTGATTGGTDIVAMLVNKFGKIPIPQAVLLVDSSIVIIGMLVFGDWKLPLYSLVCIFVMSKSIDLVLGSTNMERLLFIISDKHEQIKDYILNDIQRGATYIKSSGMYTENEREMVFLVVDKTQVTSVQSKVKEIDSGAFLVIVNATEAYGDGFKEFEKPKERKKKAKLKSKRQ